MFTYPRGGHFAARSEMNAWQSEAEVRSSTRPHRSTLQPQLIFQRENFPRTRHHSPHSRSSQSSVGDTVEAYRCWPMSPERWGGDWIF
ncbi:unnamed protein product [Arctia plantaginis]|uniref:Uncharacterized protein n=1 Tax=Arctia plantaginis TaxID=874455 RepID=A0A8S0YYR1_ARCPL|nr:unnamed protein product [Arctia plantaginis]CAB3256577.1 unnamed protein product [Arctia plantaginis]